MQNVTFVKCCVLGKCIFLNVFFFNAVFCKNVFLDAVVFAGVLYVSEMCFYGVFCLAKSHIFWNTVFSIMLLCFLKCCCIVNLDFLLITEQQKKSSVQWLSLAMFFFFFLSFQQLFSGNKARSNSLNYLPSSKWLVKIMTSWQTQSSI